MQYAIVEYIIKNRWYIINRAQKKRKKERKACDNQKTSKLHKH